MAEEAQAYLAAQRSAEVTPTVTALRRRASEVIDAELLRLDSRLPELDARGARRVRPQRPPGRRQAPAHPDGAGEAARRGAGRRTATRPRCARCSSSTRRRRAAVAIQRSGDVLAALEAPCTDSRTRGRTADDRPAHRHPAQRARHGPDRASSPTGCARPGHACELVEISTSGDRSLGAGRRAGRRRVRLRAARRAGARRGRHRRALLQGPAHRARPAAAPRRRAAAGGPPRRAGGPRRDGARRAARRLADRHRLAAAHRAARRARAGPRRRRRSAATSTPGSARCAPASSTRWSSPRPGCAGWAASTRPPSCSTRCRCCPRPPRARWRSSAGRERPRARRASLAAVLDDEYTRAAVTAERAVLATLEAGCSAPVGALADVVSDLDDDGQRRRPHLAARGGRHDRRGAAARLGHRRHGRRREARCGTGRRAARPGGRSLPIAENRWIGSSESR